LAPGSRWSIVVTPAGLDTPLPAPTDFAARTLRIGVGDRLERELLLESFEAPATSAPRRWSRSGSGASGAASSTSSPPAIRVRCESSSSATTWSRSRRFDPTSQRSTDPLDELLVLPLGAPAEDTDGAGRLLDYIPAGAPAIIDAPGLLDETSDEAPGRRALREILGDRPRVELETLAGTGIEHVLDTQEVPRFTAHFVQLTEALGRWRAEGFTVRLVAGDEHQAEHLRQILRDNTSRRPSSGPSMPPNPRRSWWASARRGSRSRRWAWCCSPRRRSSGPDAARSAGRSTSGVRPSRLHRPRGRRPGRPRGSRHRPLPRLRTMSVGDRDGDFLLLEYAEGGRLYVPVERLDLVSKYLGGDAGTAKLDRMGGASWQRVKESVRAALREMAEGLLKLYAQRAWPRAIPSPPTRRGSASSRRRSASRRRRSAARDRRGQARHGEPAAHGPPGGGRRRYGKTEVALRAAFKAVGDGHQVAVLVPTTVLAQQHWSTFTDRFGPSRPRSSCSRASARRRSRRRWWRGCARARSTS
jgi:hypothetical protein